jgi:UDP-N-acetylglucosamine--dolichyl-phosphate N-acetylglucosaminephosphotransferase
MVDVTLTGAIVLSIAISFVVTYKLTPILRERFLLRGIVGVDEHKKDKPRIAEMGGAVIVAGYLVGILFLLVLFPAYLRSLLAVLTMTLMITMIGLMDDILKLAQRTKVIVPVLASLPLVMVVSGDRSMLIPFIGYVPLGFLYPLLLVPIGVVAACNLTNLLAGFNGLEAGMGLIASVSVLVASLLQFVVGGKGSAILGALTLAPLVGSLLAFLRYNVYPAKIFPGNSGTYLIGGTIAAAVILGGITVIGIVTLTPFIIEFFMKAKAGFKGTCFGKLNSDGTLSPRNSPHESLTQIIMARGRLSERKLVAILWLIQAGFGGLAIVIAYYSLYFMLFK